MYRIATDRTVPVMRGPDHGEPAEHFAAGELLPGVSSVLSGLPEEESKMQSKTRILVEIALTVALAAVLNTFKLFHMPQGGTVSLAMLPIIVLALRHGLGVGIIGGLLYGVVDFYVDPYPPVHWIQYVLDYPLAYAAVGFAGVGASAWRRFSEKGTALHASWKVVVPAGLLATAGRYAAHFVSGMVFFGAYAPEGQPVWLYSALYNLYVPVSGVLCIAAAATVMPALSGLAVRRRASATEG